MRIIISMMKKMAAAGMVMAGIMLLFPQTVRAESMTLCVERSTIGQELLMEPTVVEYEPGERCADVLLRGLKQAGITPIYERNSQYGFYLQGIEKGDAGTLNIPEVVKNVLDKKEIGVTGNAVAPDLSEFSYSSASGWTYTLNHEYMNVGMGTAPAVDGAAMRVMFTIAGGPDITGNDPATNVEYFKAVDKSNLVRIMGQVNADLPRWQESEYFESAYNGARDTLKNITATENDVLEAVSLLEDVEKSLPTEATSISLNKDQLKLYVNGDSETLTASVLPEGAYSSVTWSSDKEAIATVSDGVVTPVAMGTAVITVTNSNGLKASCEVQVLPEQVPVEGIELASDHLELTTRSAPAKIEYELLPLGGTAESITWTSDDLTVAVVSEDGTVTPMGSGETDVHMVTDNGTCAICHVTVVLGADSMSISDAAMTLIVDDTPGRLSCGLVPADSGEKVTWSSDDTAIAQVNQDGVVTPVAAGETTIRATAQGGLSVACVVTVKASERAAFVNGMPTMRIASVDSHSVTVNWNAYAYADSYYVLRRKVGEMSWTKLAETAEVSYVDASVAATEQYYYGIQAVSGKWGDMVTSVYNTSLIARVPAVSTPTAEPTAAAVPQSSVDSMTTAVSKAKPKLTLKAGKKKVTIKWKKVSGASGYEVYRSTKKNKGYKKVKTIRKGTTLTYVNKKLKKGTTYYYKVRAYRTVNGKKIYSKYSAVKKVRIKK